MSTTGMSITDVIAPTWTIVWFLPASFPPHARRMAAAIKRGAYRGKRKTRKAMHRLMRACEVAS